VLATAKFLEETAKVKQLPTAWVVVEKLMFYKTDRYKGKSFVFNLNRRL
jgi:hypothetical protein